jgi:hypothetical protein
MADPSEQPPPIKLEYASRFTRTRSARILGVVFSLVLASIGVMLAGPGCAIMVDAVTHARSFEILSAIALIAGGGGFCWAAWFIQKHYVFAAG